MVYTRSANGGGSSKASQQVDVELMGADHHQSRNNASTNQPKKASRSRFITLLLSLPLMGIAFRLWRTDFSTLGREDLGSRHAQYRVDCHHGVSVQQQDPTNDTHVFVKTSTTPAFDMSVYPLHKDAVISKHIAEEGCWECAMVRRVTEALRQDKGAFLVDIGGNVGMFALSAAAMGRKVFVFEPLKQSYEHICRSVERNHFHSQVHLFRVAAARQLSRVALFTFGRKNMGGTGTRVVKEPGNEGESQQQQQHKQQQQEGVHFARGVPIDVLRDVFPKNAPAVLKIDVEGVEIDALAGAKQFLRDTEIILAQMELRPPALASNPETEAVFNILYSKGLKPMWNKGDELVPMEGDWRMWKNKYPLGRMFDVSWVRS